jgi:hypothetical protein
MRGECKYRVYLSSIEKIENDRTRPNLLHTGLKPNETAKKHNEGWSHFLDELTKYCIKRSKQT